MRKMHIITKRSSTNNSKLTPSCKVKESKEDKDHREARVVSASPTRIHHLRMISSNDNNNSLLMVDQSNNNTR